MPILLLLTQQGIQAQPLIASYPFSGNANDATGNGHNGTVHGGMKLTDDRFGNANSAYNFDGVDDYISVPHSAALNFSGSYSISVWVKFCVKQPNGFRGLVEKGDGYFKPGYTLHITARQVWFDPSSAGGGNAVGATLLDDGRWHHIVAVAKDTTTIAALIKVYIDGVIDGTGITGPSAYDGITDLLIGKHVLAEFFFKGAIDDVRLYDTALSAAQVQSIYHEGGWPITSSTTVNLSLKASDSVICPGDKVQLTALGNATQYSWRPSPDLQGQTSATPIAAPLTTTTYKVRAMRIAGGEPCPDTVDKFDSITITVRQAPKIELGLPRYVCSGQTIEIGADATEGTPPYRYYWTSTTPIFDPTEVRQKIEVTESRQYIVTVTDAVGCIGRDTVTVTALGLPKMDAGSDTGICRGGAVELGSDQTSGDPPFTYAWTPGAGLSDTSVARPLASPDTTTEYIVRVSNRNGCEWLDTVVVRVNGLPNADAGKDVEMCADSVVVLSGSVSGGDAGASVQWSPSAGLSCDTCLNPTARPTTTTTYRLTVTNGSGCVAVDSVRVTVLEQMLAAERSTIEFGELDGCTSVRDTVVTITNDGADPVTLAEAVSDNGSFSLISPTLPRTIDPGESMEVRIRFSPTGSGSVAGRVVLQGTRCGRELAFDVSGSRSQSLVGSDRGSVNFGRTLACQDVERDTTITVSNSSTAPAVIDPGLVSVPFSVVSPMLPVTLGAGESVTLTVRYKPTTAGVYNDDLLLPFSSGSCQDTVRVRLQGTHAEPRLVVPTEIDFGTLSGCQNNRDTTIILKNAGEDAVTLQEATLPSGFVLVTPLPVSVPGNGSVEIALRFEPLGSGIAAGSVVFGYEPCSGETSMGVRGMKRGVSVAVVDTVDFGSVISCSGMGMSRRITIAYGNDDGDAGEIASVTTSGPFTTTVMSGTGLPDGSKQEYEVSFTAQGDGEFTGSIDLRIEPCGIVRHIGLHGVWVTPELMSAPVYDFGALPTGSYQTMDLVYTNSGLTPVTVDRIDGVLPPFSLETTIPPLPVELAPGETLTVRVGYRAGSGEQSTTVGAVVTSPCDLRSETEVRGSGESGSSLTLSLPVLEATAGEHVTVPLTVESSTNIDGLSNATYSARLRYNSSLLLPVGGTSSGTVIDSERVVTISGRVPMGFSGGTLGEGEFIATLGSVDRTRLHVDTVIFDVPVTVTATDGEFRLNGLCRYGTLRVVEGQGHLTLKPSRPNPTSWRTEIEYELIEGGPTRLYIVDGLGRRVLGLVDGNSDRGRYIVEFDASVLGSGRYVCVLETPTQRLTQMMSVVK